MRFCSKCGTALIGVLTVCRVCAPVVTPSSFEAAADAMVLPAKFEAAVPSLHSGVNVGPIRDAEDDQAVRIVVVQNTTIIPPAGQLSLGELRHNGLGSDDTEMMNNTLPLRS